MVKISHIFVLVKRWKKLIQLSIERTTIAIVSDPIPIIFSQLDGTLGISWGITALRQPSSNQNLVAANGQEDSGKQEGQASDVENQIF